MITVARTYHFPRNLPDRWTTAWGEDRYGVWSDVTIQGVVQRFRWIEPGEFWMGSPGGPDGEPERYDNETQHHVVLSQGYWLADTACTQELWQAMMGANPSNFKGEELPVENVSWEDCQRFFDKVNKKMPELNLRFPTEADWEYACRAGTSTPFSFGNNISTDQVNFKGSSPYAEGKKGKARGKTVQVKALPANDWGLYQMHGNVYEWCEDWFGTYPEDRVVDPRGPDNGVNRVRRGGSWNSYGRWCRSAVRLALPPGIRNDDIGFRLSRGQVEPGNGTAEPRGVVQSEVERSGTGDAPRRGGRLGRIEE